MKPNEELSSEKPSEVDTQSTDEGISGSEVKVEDKSQLEPSEIEVDSNTSIEVSELTQEIRSDEAPEYEAEEGDDIIQLHEEGEEHPGQDEVFDNQNPISPEKKDEATKEESTTEEDDFSEDQIQQGAIVDNDSEVPDGGSEINQRTDTEMGVSSQVVTEPNSIVDDKIMTGDENETTTTSEGSTDLLTSAVDDQITERQAQDQEDMMTFENTEDEVKMVNDQIHDDIAISEDKSSQVEQIPDSSSDSTILEPQLSGMAGESILFSDEMQEIRPSKQEETRTSETQNQQNLDNKVFQFELFRAIDLTKAYGETIALNGLNFTTSSRSIGILGPNGCGKSTFLKLLLRLIRPTKGSIELSPKIKDIRVIPDYPVLPADLTIDEWMEMLEQFHGKLIPDVDVQTSLNLQGEWKIKELSAGQYRKAALLPAFFGSPELIILDEPTNFLDIVTREYVLQLLFKQVQTHNSRIIIASHRVDEIRLLADQAIILKNGSMMKSIDLYHQPIRSYEIIVEQSDLFIQHLKENDIAYARKNDRGVDLFEIPNLTIIWDVLGDFVQDRGIVVSMKSVDELDKNIMELLN